MGELADTLHRLERSILPHLKGEQDLQSLTAASGLKEVEVKRALQWLSNKKLVELKEESAELIELDSNGLVYRQEGLPERRALKMLAEQGKRSSNELMAGGIEQQEINIIVGTLKKKAAVEISKEKGELVLSITDAGKALAEKESLEEQFLQGEFPRTKESLKAEEQFAFDNLKSRKNIVKLETRKTLYVKPTKAGSALVKKGISQEAGVDRLTPQMLSSGSWRTKKFRPYDVSINVPKLNRGKSHFVNDATNYAKRIWLDMGFTEMTGSHVQTSFWDLDALFVPQDHPAREMQDTYYLKQPATGSIRNAELLKKVKAVHENGGDTGSKGWQMNYDKGMALLNLLRTHTTVLSAQTLSKLKKENLPAKFFTINKVYRNESLDWKHLFEFHQVEGIVVDPEANLEHLKGYLIEFYRKMGFEKVRMRPGYFPYTEPSLEPEVWHPVKKQWVEMGGAGIFRPEVTKTLLGEEIPVLAWGLGLERSIMNFYDIHDIRELYNNDLGQLRRMKTYLGEKR